MPNPTTGIWVPLARGTVWVNTLMIHPVHRSAMASAGCGRVLSMEPAGAELARVRWGSQRFESGEDEVEPEHELLRRVIAGREERRGGLVEVRELLRGSWGR